MTFTEDFVKDNIRINFEAEVRYGSDQADETYPVQFPTVEFELIATDKLSAIADRIRKDLGELIGVDAAETVRIQYGGSMKPGNAAELLAKPDIDGGLIGGAALKADSFAGIIAAAAAAQ